VGVISPFFRIADVNLNRAREACRVLDDLCRFVLNDAALCERWKGLRHAIVSVAAGFNAADLLASRDSEQDVGREVSTPAEFARAGEIAVARSATGRLSEALRSLEEASKALGLPGVAAGFERLRYETYTLEKATLERFPQRAGPQWRLCVLVTESLCALPWTETIKRALGGGADCVQLREKTLEGGELLERAFVARDLTRAAGCGLVINDRPDVAAASGADGVHLGQLDTPAAQVRKVFGRSLVIGVSTSNPSEAGEAVAAGADYCGLGPMFTTTTKVKPVLAGPAYAAAYLADHRLAATPHLAIGGITLENVGELRSFGVVGIAVSSVVCRADNPGEVCRRLRSVLGV